MWMDNANEAGLTKISRSAHDLAPVLKHVETDKSQLHLWRKGVVHANQRRGPSGATATDVIFVEDHDLARISLSKLECNGRSHDARTQDHNVRSLREIRVGRACTHATASRSRPFFQSRNA